MKAMIHTSYLQEDTDFGQKGESKIPFGPIVSTRQKENYYYGQARARESRWREKNMTEYFY